MLDSHHPPDLVHAPAQAPGSSPPLSPQLDHTSQMELDMPEPKPHNPHIPYPRDAPTSPPPPSQSPSNTLTRPDAFRIPETPRKGPASKKRLLDISPSSSTPIAYTRTKPNPLARGPAPPIWDSPPLSAQKDSHDPSPDGQPTREAIPA